MTTTTSTVEETLAWEAEKRPRIAAIAIVGGLLTILGNVLLTIVSSSGPTADDGFISLTGALERNLAGQEPEGPSLLVRQVDHVGDNAPLLGFGTLLVVLASIALGLTVLFLYRATVARTEQVGRLPYYATLLGLVVYPLGRALRDLAFWIGAVGFEDDPVRNAGAARDLGRTSLAVAGSLLEFVGMFSLAVGILLVAINAMRVGLLTRFFGILGVIVGVLVSGALATLLGDDPDRPGVVRAFWLVGVGLLIAGRLKTPPAWETGRAEPWPTQQQLREQREAAQGTKRDRDERPTEDEALKPEHARKKRKKRKR